MPANYSCHPVEVLYMNDRAGHRSPSSPLATPPSWGDVTPAANVLASIWARIHVQVCVPVTCQKSCISQRKMLVDRLSKSKDKHSRAQLGLIPNPEMKVQSWHYAYDRRENTLFQQQQQKSLFLLFMFWKNIPTPVQFCLQCTVEICTHMHRNSACAHKKQDFSRVVLAL